jgi:hypothetical protein
MILTYRQTLHYLCVVESDLQQVGIGTWKLHNACLAWCWKLRNWLARKKYLTYSLHKHKHDLLKGYGGRRGRRDRDLDVSSSTDARRPTRPAMQPAAHPTYTNFSSLYFPSSLPMYITYAKVNESYLIQNCRQRVRSEYLLITAAIDECLEGISNSHLFRRRKPSWQHNAHLFTNEKSENNNRRTKKEHEQDWTWYENVK